MEHEIIKDLQAVIATIHDIGGGVDEEADRNNDSPEDMNQHLGGLVWQELNRILPLIRALIDERDDLRSLFDLQHKAQLPKQIKS